MTPLHWLLSDSVEDLKPVFLAVIFAKFVFIYKTRWKIL